MTEVGGLEARARLSEREDRRTTSDLTIDVTEQKCWDRLARNDLDLVDARAPVWTEVDLIQDLKDVRSPKEPKSDPKHPCSSSYSSAPFLGINLGLSRALYSINAGILDAFESCLV